MSKFEKWDTPATRFGLAILAMIIAGGLLSVIGEVFFPMMLVSQPGISN